MNQPNLFDQQAKLRAQAAAWITANPQAFALFERFALEAAYKRRRFGMKMLAEKCRWEWQIALERDAEGFRLNNDVVAYLGRELVARHPSLIVWIEFRKCRDEREGEPILQVVKGET
jgi:hypothetical protein